MNDFSDEYDIIGYVAIRIYVLEETMKKVDSIIFDLDGTLWDTRDAVVNVWNEAFKEYGVDLVMTTEWMNQLMGYPCGEAMDMMLESLSDEMRNRIKTECANLETSRILEKRLGIVFDGVEEVLEKLSKDYRLFIVSNCQCGYIEVFFEINGLGKYFEDYENAERTGLSKGENNRLVIERNNLKNPIYIGDTPGDAKSAEVAGIPFVYAKYGFGKVEKFDREINDIRDLLELDIIK